MLRHVLQPMTWEPNGKFLLLNRSRDDFTWFHYEKHVHLFGTVTSDLKGEYQVRDYALMGSWGPWGRVLVEHRTQTGMRGVGDNTQM